MSSALTAVFFSIVLPWKSQGFSFDYSSLINPLTQSLHYTHLKPKKRGGRTKKCQRGVILG